MSTEKKQEAQTSKIATEEELLQEKRLMAERARDVFIGALFTLTSLLAVHTLIDLSGLFEEDWKKIRVGFAFVYATAFFGFHHYQLQIEKYTQQIEEELRKKISAQQENIDIPR